MPVTPLAALFVSVVPGLGQLAAGRPGLGLAWFIGVGIAYSLHPLLGFLLHLVAAGQAFFVAQQAQVLYIDQQASGDYTAHNFVPPFPTDATMQTTLASLEEPAASFDALPLSHHSERGAIPASVARPIFMPVEVPVWRYEPLSVDAFAEAITASSPSEHPVWAVRVAAAGLSREEAERLLAHIDAHACEGMMARPDVLRFHAALS